VLAVPMIAFADTRAFFWSELLANGALMGFAAISVLVFSSLQGIGFGFLAMYALYGVFTVAYARRRLDFRLDGRVLRSWLIGFIVLIAASAYTWQDTAVHWPSAAIWIALSLSTSWFSLEPAEKSTLKGWLVRRVSA
jgi:hypothetical protein